MLVLEVFTLWMWGRESMIEIYETFPYEIDWEAEWPKNPVERHGDINT